LYEFPNLKLINGKSEVNNELKKDWYRTWFSNKLYLELYKHRDNEDARNLINLIQRNVNFFTGSKVLDICCGAGRHSIELAKRGLDVTGFDLSEFLINEARYQLKNVKEKNLKVKFLVKDMRDFNFNNSFNLAVNLFTSFGYFERDEENFSVFKNASSSISKNGWFVFDFLNGEFLKKNLKKMTKTSLEGKLIIQKRRLENDFVIKDIIIRTDKDEQVFTERLKLFDSKTLFNVLEKNKLKTKNVFGDYYGNKFELNKSSRFVIFAQKN
jgi:SAM-dependent methyltransferase